MKEIKQIFLGRDEYYDILTFGTLWRISRVLINSDYWKKYYKMSKDWFTRWNLANKAYLQWRSKCSYDPNALYFPFK